MAMPIFTPGDDPGSSFPELLRRIGQEEGLGDAVGFRLLRLGREHTHSEPRGHPLPGSTSASRKENRK